MRTNKKLAIKLKNERVTYQFLISTIGRQVGDLAEKGSVAGILALLGVYSCGIGLRCRSWSTSLGETARVARVNHLCCHNALISKI